MFREILTNEQVALLPLIRQFSKGYYMVGGTAIALQIGHRRSIDFDLFTKDRLKRKHIKNIIERSGYPTTDILFEAEDQLHIVLNGVKTTFFQYPFELQSSMQFDTIIRMPLLLDLAAMKAYALGGRAKWKDYVDLYFIMKKYHSFSEIATKAKELYESFFNEKLLKEQLSYFDDIDYSEEVEFVSAGVTQDEVKSFLVQVATEKF